MYVMVVFALALLSPLPFISPFEYNVQDATAQSPFGPSDSTAPPSNHQIEIDAANIIITELSHTFRASGSSITAGSPNFMHPITINGYDYVITYGDQAVMINITNPSSVHRTDALSGFVTAIDTFIINNTHYAMAGSYSNVDMYDITNPNNVLNAYRNHGTNNNNQYAHIPNFQMTDGGDLAVIEIDNSHYSVTSFGNMIQIHDITDPLDISNVSTITDTTSLVFPTNIEIFEINNFYYALVTSPNVNSLVMVNITDPYNLSMITTNNNNNTYVNFDDVVDVEVITIKDSLYALMTSELESSFLGVKMINITDLSNPSNVFNLDTSDGLILDGNNFVAVATLKDRHYALITSNQPAANFNKIGFVQIIDITNPKTPYSALLLNHTKHNQIGLPGDFEIVEINGSTYAISPTRSSTNFRIMELEVGRNLLNITSNNTNPAYAKAGDKLTVHLTLDYFDHVRSASILGHSLSTNRDGNYLNLSRNVPNTDIEYNATFHVTVRTGSIDTYFSQDDLSYQNIFVDTIAPKISIDGNKTTYSLLQNRSIDRIPNATASDGSPGYLGLYNTTITGNLDNSIIGSTANYTYTAYPDAAGNLGDSINLTVTVTDYPPINITSLTVKSDNSVNSSSYARAGDKIIITLDTDGTDVGNVTGNILGDDNFTQNSSNGTIIFSKTITQNDTNGNPTFDIFMTNSSEHAIRVTHENLTGDNIIIDTVLPLIYLYGTNNTISNLGSSYVDTGAISYDLSYGIKDVTGTGTVDTSTAGTYHITYDAPDFAGNPANIIRTVHVQQLAPISLTNETSQFLVSPTANVSNSSDYPYLGDPYRVTTVKIDDTIYALIAAYNDDGFTILNITIPDSPTLVFNVTGETGINANLRGPTGISTIQIQNSIYAVITSLLQSRVSILDITNPAQPVVKSVTTNTDNVNVRSPFAVSTVDIDGTAYAIVASRADSRIAIFNITNPMNLTQVSVLEHGEDYTLGGITNIIPIKMDGSTYILTAARDNNSVGIIDIGNPKMPRQVALFEDDDDLALHSAHSIEIIPINGRTYALVASPNDNGMQIIDVTHPALPFPVSSVRNSTEYPALLKPHDVTAIKVEDSTYALLSAVTADSIQIIDITNPESPQPASHITHGTEYTHLDRPQTLKAVQIDGTAYALIAARDSDGIQIIKLEHEKTIQTPFSITSNNANSSYAKAGDTVSIQITVNDTIDQSRSMVQILNLNVSTDTIGLNTINTSVTIPTDSIEMNASITASITNYLGVTVNLTEANLTGANVFVDTISPKIELTGDANHTIFVNSNYEELGAVASDGDPNYIPNYTITTSGSLNNTMVGSFELYTYIADPDAAGNLGENVTRNVTVVDYEPITVTDLIANSDNSVNGSYAKVGDEIRLTLTADDPIETVTGVVLGDDNLAVSQSRGDVIIRKTINQNDTNGNLTFDIFVSNSSGYAARVTQEDLVDTLIIIDTIHPTITLNGKNNTISILNRTYTDENATVYDLSYGSKNIPPMGDVNITREGNYTLIYSAPPDFAGNEAQNITRNVIVADLPPIEVQTLSVTSTNVNNASYAKVGDNITVRLAVNNAISTYNVEILNDTLSLTVINSTHEINATRSIPNNLAIQKYATFNIAIENNQTVMLTVTQENITDSNVFVDTIAPTISINGDITEYYLLQNRSTNLIPNATATDGDPNYARTYTVTSNTTLNTSVLGSSAIYTYTADPDGAGNTGASVNLTVTVVDYGSLNITDLTVHSDNSNNSYAKAGDQVNITLITDGSDITNATGSILGDEIFTKHTSNGTIIFSKTITQNDTNGNLTFDILVINSSEYASRVTQEDLMNNNIIIDTIPPNITLNGKNNTISVLNRAYADANATAYDVSYGSINIPPVGTVDIGTEGNYTLTYSAPFDLAGNAGPNITRNVIVRDLPPISFDVFDVSSAGSFKFTTDDITSYHVDTFQIDTATYAGLSSDSGLFIINITDINSPSLVSTVFNGSLSGDASSFVVPHTTFVSIDGSTYALSAHSSGVLITNVNNPASPSFVAYVTDGQDGFTRLNSVQSIATTTIGSSTYALAASYFDHGVQIIDITNPYAPTPVSAVTNGQDNFTTLAFALSIATTTIGSSTYALVASSGNNGVQIIDITTPSSPTPASAITDGSNYTELSGAQSVTTTTIGSSTYALVAASVDNGVQIINITTPSSPTPASAITDGQGNFTTLSGAQSITTTTIGSSTYALVAAKGDSGVQIINITNPYAPTSASSIIDNSDGFTELEDVSSITTITIGSSIYALTASSGDTGIEIINLNYPLTIKSSNTNPAYAKAGDVLTLDFKVNDTIVSSTTQFTNLDQIPSVTITNATSSATYIATLTVPSDPIEDYADFVITLENNQSVTLSVTENDLPSNVFIDTISPRIELVGDSDHTVYVGTQNPIIPGAIATDNSPGYSASYSTSIAGTLDTSSIGSNVIYTYTAHPDVAGNLGENVTRSVTVVGYDPLNVTSLTVSSDNSINSSYAKAGDTITIRLSHYGIIDDAIGNILGDENFTVSKYSGTTDLTKTINQSDANGNLTFDILVTNSSGYAASVTRSNLTGSNIIIDTISPVIYLYGINNTVSHVGSPYVDAGAISYDLSYGIKDVTGTGTVNSDTIGTYTVTYDAPDSAGNPADITRTVHVQEIPQLSLSSESSDLLITPESPIADPAQYPYLTDPFHIETVQIDGSTYALVASNKDGGFTILNMDNPESPSLVFSATRTQTNYSAIQGILGASPIQIQGKTYVVTISQSKILIADITNPESTTFVSERSNGTDYPYLHAMTAISTFNIGDAAYAIIVSQSDSWVSILNITEPANPTHLTVLENGANYDLNTPRHIAIIDADGSTFAVITSRTTGTVTILNMDNPEMPVQIHAIKDGIDLALTSATGIEIVQIDTRSYALVVSNNDHAMQIIDITHPQLPFPVSTVQSSGTEYSGLNSPHYVTALQVEDATYAFVTSPSIDSVQVIDITNPSQPNPVAVLQHGTEFMHLDFPLYIESIQTDDAAYALVGSRDSNGIEIIKLGYNITTQTPFSITSNNTNSSYAKAGDTVSIQITVNDTIDQSRSMVQILNLNVSTDTIGLNTINTSVTIPTDSIEMNASITASITNYLGVTVNLTEANLTGANVFVDTISPKIELTGDANHTIFVNSNYEELGAVASDGDPNYIPNYTITTSGSLNNTMVGSFELYTYIADPDAAGNLGENVTRNVTVVDYEPITVTDLIASSDNSVNGSYAKVGDEIRLTLTADDPIETVTGVVLGDDNFTVSQSRGDVIIRKTINQNDTNGNLTFDIFVSNSSGYAARVTQDNLTSSNIIIDTVHPLLYLYGANNTVSYVGSSYVDAGAISYDLSYGIQNVTGTSTVDTSTVGTYNVAYDAPDFAGHPANIIRIVHVKELQQLSLTSESSDLLITSASTITDSAQYQYLADPHDIEIVQIGSSLYALVASYTDSGFTILNMDDPISPDLVFNATSTKQNYSAISGIVGVSPIQIQDKTYAVTISAFSSKILIVDITNPESPIFVSERSNGTDYPYLHAMTSISTVNIGDAAYTMIASQSESWVAILNITEPANPTHLTVLQDGENYDLDGPRHIKTIDADDSTFAIITARLGGTVTILNMDNPEMPEQTLVIKDSANVSLSHATGIEIVQINTRTYALVASSFDNAMQIIDITHPRLSFPVSTVHMSTNYSGLSEPHYVAALQVEDATYAFVTSPSTNSTQVIDITNPFQPNPVTVLQNGTEYTHLDKPFDIESIQIDDTAYALVGSRDSNGIQIINLGYDITTQTPFSITSNNANSSYAKVGDTVSIQITVNDTIDQSKSTVQIQNLNANVNKTSLNTIEASVTIPTDSIEINANVTALITNYLGATLDLTETDLTAQNVFIDTISPTMELIGDANHVVIVNNIYSEPGAIAIDGSPGYNASNYSVIVTGSLNTSMIDSTVNYTYTAYPDAAGNPGTSINRTVTIVDYDPLNVVILNVSSNNSVNNSYAKAGDNVTITLVTDGSDVGDATGDILDDNNFAKNPSGNTIIFSKIITQSDPNGNLTFDILVTNSSGYAARVTQDNLANSNIIIDTIPPTITLNGENDTISILNRAYTDANATAYDLSYGEKSILTNGIVNTNVIGNYSLSYTAESDLAGNAGPTITRNVIVKDLVSFEIQILSVTSTNVNNASYAKIGDNITVRLAVNDTIATHDVEILNDTLSLIVTNSTNEINATLSVPNNLAIEKYATFNIGIENSLTIPINVTQENITGSNIFVDTIPPAISVNGDITEYSLLQNRSTDLIPNATATDGDPNYAGTYTVTNNSILNTSMLGASATYTYTADPDGAGNLGTSVDLIVTVTDYTQLNITALTVSSDNSNSSYARAGDHVNITLITDGSDIASVTGAILGDASFTQQNSSGTITLSKTITQSDTNGNLTFDIFVTNSTGSAARVTQENILNNNNIIIDTVSPLLYLYGVNNTVSYVGSSYVDAGAISYDISYGIQNVTGTSTVTGTVGTYDVTYDAPDFAGNPANIMRIVHVQELLQLSLTSESSSLLLTPESPIADPVQYPHLTDPFHIETVQIDGSTYALVASNIDSGFTILNMDNPESPSLVFNATRTQTNYSAIQGILGASPIQIQGKTYVVTISSSSKILIADITNPESTTFVSERSNGTDYPYLHAMTAISTFSIGDAAYAMIVSQSESWVSILNITAPANPTHLTVLENGANYDLNSPRHIAIIDADGSTFAVITSRTTGTVTILNMDNPEMPVQIHAIKDGIGLALSSATGIEIVEINTRTYALVASNLDNAMQIIDITHPQLPFPVSTVQRSGTEYSGLVGPHYVAALQVENATYAFVTSPSTNSTQVIDITNPFQPNPVAVLQNGAEYTHLAKPLYIESIQTDDAAYALVGARDSNGIEIIKLGYEKTIQTPFSITSNNANSSYAKAGDTVSIQITVNDTIDQSKSTVQIQNLNAIVSASGLNTIEATVTIPTDSIEINASITALITSYLGATLDLTATDLTAKNVFIDTIAPTITPIGDANYAALVGTSYTDQGAIASDGSPGYDASNYSTSKTGNVNTSDIGSIVTYTYTAYDDAAGNPGASATRIVTVVDHEPINVTSLTVNSNNSVNNSYAKAGDEITIALVTDGSDITNITGTILGDASFTKQNSSGTVTLSKIITQSDTNDNLTFSIFVINSTDYASTVTQEDLTGENIIIDTIPPTITLNGNNTDTVEFGSTYTDLGANIADASYEDTTIYINDVVDTFTIGTYSLVYTAPDDPAGNLGPSVTRTINVSDSTPRMLDSLSLSTSNNNPAYAKAGDIITVTLIVNQPISNATITIQNEVVNHIIQNDTLYANYTIQDSQNGNPTLEITANFDSSLPLTVNESNLTTTIYIDTEKPIITLIGHSNITIPINLNYVDDDASVDDNDPLYNGNVSSNDSEVNTAISDTYTIVYSADADNAGNIPDDVTRTVTVSDFFLGISSDNANYDDLAKEGDLVSVKIISDPYANSLITDAIILGRSTSDTSIIGNTIYANATVLDSDVNGNITFSITLNLTTGTLVTLTNDNLTSANVVVDTIAPVMLSASTVTPTLVEITFDEPITIGSFILRKTTMIPEPLSADVQDGSSIPSSVLEFTIPLESPLSSDATPDIMIESSNIRDLAGNGVPEISTTLSDGIAPSIQSAIVVSSSLIEVIFDEEIKFISPTAIFHPAPTVNEIPTNTPRDISGNILRVPSQNAFPTDTVLHVNISTDIITDIAGNVFVSSTILTSATNVLVPYTVDELTIHVPYAMTLSPNTLSTGDYRITFGTNPPSVISTVDLSNDATTVILTMTTPFGTGDTPFVEQIGTITDTFNNDVTIQSAIADDRAPPTLVSVVASSTSDITVTFSEKISSKSTSIINYDLSGATIRNTGLGIADGTVVISTSMFVRASITISNSTTIEDISNNTVQGDVTQPVINN